MKTIWIEGIETAGLIHDLSIGFRKAGFRVITFAESNIFYNYTYDINKYSFIADLKKNDLLQYPLLTSLGFRIINTFASGKREKYLKYIQKKVLFHSIDFFLPIYTWHFLENNDFKLFKRNRVRLIGYFLGSDIRIYDVFCRHFLVDRTLISDDYFKESFLQKAVKLRVVEKYSHCIFSVPDQMSLAERPYFHLQLPFYIDKFVYSIPLRKRPLIIHCPSNAGIKGTSIILEVIEKMRKMNIEFDFELILNKPHTELLEILTKADILIDEIILHGPGLLSFEAMASGCAVLTKFYDNSPTSFRPPIISITPDNLLDKLIELIANTKLREEHAKAGRAYLLKNNSLEKIVNDMSKQFYKQEISKSGYDYYPDLEFVKKNVLTLYEKQQLKSITV